MSLLNLDRAQILGNSPGLRDVLADADAVAGTDSKILITGESGVGKELLARRIQCRSPRAHLPMVTINCAGVPDSLLESEMFGHKRGSFTGADRDRRGLLEMADCGTILLDEVGEMSLRMQRALLRFLENGEIQPIGSDRPERIVNVRIMAATNRDLLEQVRKKEFREDLYYRLNIVHLVIPPLRQRREDIRGLFEHFLTEISRHHKMPMLHFSTEALIAIEEYNWPGNVREVRNLVERLVVTHRGGIVEVRDLGLDMMRRASVPTVPADVSRTPEGLAETCYNRMTRGRESFWVVVHEPFMMRDLTRETVRAVVRQGLEQTKGSYRLVAELFNLPPQDCKRFLNFLQKHDCQLRFQKFRMVSASADRDLARPSDKAAAM